MTRDPISVRNDATIREAISFLAAKDASSAPVIDEAGRAVGVLSLSDIVKAVRDHDYDASFFDSQASDVMTPLVLCVSSSMPIDAVVDLLLECEVHQVYIVDEHGILIGRLGTQELLCELHRRAAAEDCDCHACLEVRAAG
jgi:CBS domain-containing protein